MKSFFLVKFIATGMKNNYYGSPKEKAKRKQRERELVIVGRTALSHFRNKTMNHETHLQITSHRIFTFIFG